MESVIRLLIHGERACFVRPEMRMDRVSYEVMPPAAARSVLAAIYLKPSIRWEVIRIHVLRPIRMERVPGTSDADSLDDDGPGGERAGSWDCAGRAMPLRCGTVLLDVSYLVEAGLSLTPRALATERIADHLAVFARRARAGTFFHQPCLGERDFPAEFELLEPGAPVPPSLLPSLERDRDLGWMLHEVDYSDGQTSRFFRARLRDGVLEVASALGMGLQP